MPLETPRDLFLHELADVMSAEHIIAKLLPELRDEAKNAEAKRAFREHEAETKQQIKNLEQIFKELGEKPEQTTCFAAQGLAQEHQALHEEEPSPTVLEMAILGGASKTEHYEMAAYTDLVRMAKDLGEREAARLLQENLDQEKAMAKRVEAISKELGQEAKAMTAEAGGA